MNNAFIKLSVTCGVLGVLAGCGAVDDAAGESPLATEKENLSFHGAPFDDGQNGNPHQCVVNGLSLHCCPSVPGNVPSVMVGARLDQNVFKCAQLLSFNPSDGSPAFLDGPGRATFTQRTEPNPYGGSTTMHACPLGSVMTGFHQYTNTLLCQRLANPNLRERLDPNGATQDSYPMHVCNFDEAMSGIHVALNSFFCSR